jgi:hypothetical protein
VLASVLKSIDDYPWMEEAWTMWFMVAPCCLHISPSMNGKDNWKAWTKKAHSNMIRWLDGDIINLWNETVNASTKAYDYVKDRSLLIDPRNEEAISQARLNRVLHYISLNHASRAMQTVSNEGIAPTTEKNIVIIESKFPEAATAHMEIPDAPQCH